MARPKPATPTQKEALDDTPLAPLTAQAVDTLYQDIKQLVEGARSQVVTQVNQALVLTYWHIGKTIKQSIVIEARADYGDATMQKLADRLVMDYGAGFGRRNLFRMVQLYQGFGELPIVTTLSTQLSWSHLVELLKVDNPTKRSFYADMCAQSRWSVRTLRERMDGMLFERTAIAKQPEAVIRQELAQLAQASPTSPALFLKDPYLLDFLDLGDGFTEKDLLQCWFCISADTSCCRASGLKATVRLV